MVSYFEGRTEPLALEKKMSRKVLVFGAEKDEVCGQFKILVLHDEELHDLYRSLSIAVIVKCVRLQWAGGHAVA
jgi:hypothetical protein